MNYAMITGASSGIGLEYASQLAAMGYNILVVSNQREANETVATALKAEYGVEVIPVYADLTDPVAAQQLYDYCHLSQHIEVEILICNAGMLHFGKLIHTDGEDLQHIVALHCLAPAQLCRLFGAEMAEKKRGHIVLMSSMAAWTPFPTMSLYGATKTFLKNFGSSLWYELHDEGVSVTTVFPSAVDTDFFRLSTEARQRLRLFGLIISPEKLVKGALRAMFARHRRYIPDLWTRFEIGLCQLIPPRLFLLFMKLPSVRRLLRQL